MSMQPYVDLGFGYQIDVGEDDIFNALVELFPKEAKPYKDADGDVSDFRSFLNAVSENFWHNYPDLTFVIVSDDHIADQYLVIDDASKKSLYDKYEGGAESGVIAPNELYTEPSDSLEAFASDLGITSSPQVLIWTYWG
jgi:hypothetical protein